MSGRTNGNQDQWWVRQGSVNEVERQRFRAVAYYRHSAQDRQENSVAIQQEQVRKWAHENGVEIIHEFADRGKSGLTAAGIRVNDKFLEKRGFYELICGEGRLIAHKRLGRCNIRAEIVTCTRKQAYLESLVENLARSRPGTMEFARELKSLHDEGWSCEQIAKIACRSVEYTRQYIRLVENGEERLIQSVGQGVFPIDHSPSN